MIKEVNNMARDLTNKQKQFVLEYLKDLNATQAAIRAGYSENSAESIGFENLQKPKIAKAIQKEMDKRSERVKIDADEVLRGIIEVRDNAMQKTPKYANKKNSKGQNIKDKEGNIIREKIADNMMDRHAALKASELLGKHLKLFTDKVEHTIDANVNSMDFSDISTEDLKKLINDEEEG
jgi:phage terminase small subunit